MPQPWFTPGATTASWFGQPNSAAAASTSPQPSSGSYNPTLGSMFGQEPQQPAPARATPGIAPQAPPQASAPDFNPFPWLSKGLSLSNSFLGDAGKNLGGSGLGLSDLGGPLGLANGLYSGNVPGAIGGGLSTLGSLNNFAPGLANYLAGSNTALSGPGMAIGQNALTGSGMASGALGTLGGGLGIYSGIQGLMNGANPINSALSLGSGALGAYGGISSLMSALGAGGLPSLTAGIASLAPSTAAAVASALGVQVGANAGSQAIGTALSSALGGAAIAAAPVAMIAMQILTDSISQADARAFGTGWGGIGGMATKLYEDRQRDIPAGNQMFGALDKAGSNWQTDPMGRALAQILGSNQLFSAYNSPEGAYAPGNANQYARHFKTDMANDPTMGNAQVQRLQDSLWNNVLGAHNAGATASQIGMLPGVNPQWGNSLGGGGGQDPTTATGTNAYRWNPQLYDMIGKSTPAFNQMTGGPAMSMIAQLNPELYKTIGGNFALNSKGPYDPVGEYLRYAEPERIAQQSYSDTRGRDEALRALRTDPAAASEVFDANRAYSDSNYAAQWAATHPA